MLVKLLINNKKPCYKKQKNLNKTTHKIFKNKRNKNKKNYQQKINTK